MLDPKLMRLIESFFKLFFGLGIIILIGMFLYFALLFIVSGSEEGYKKIHQKWKYLLLGIALIFLSFTIPRIIGLFFEIDIKILQ